MNTDTNRCEMNAETHQDILWRQQQEYLTSASIEGHEFCVSAMRRCITLWSQGAGGQFCNAAAATVIGSFLLHLKMTVVFTVS